MIVMKEWATAVRFFAVVQAHASNINIQALARIMNLHPAMDGAFEKAIKLGIAYDR